MADRITLNFAANTSEVERGTDRIADGLDKTADKLDDVGRAGEQAGQDAAGGLDDAGAAADTVGGKLGDLGNVASDVLDGDFSGAAKSAVGALGGLAAAIPGLGALIGAGLATIATKFIDLWSEAAKANEERISSMFDDMIKSGNEFATQDFINASIADIIKDTEKYSQVQADAADSGVRVSLALRAQAGDQLAINAITAAATQRQVELTAAQSEYVAQNGDTSAGIDAQIGLLDDLKDRYGGVTDSTSDAADKADIYREATENAGTATGNLGAAIDGLPGSVVVDVKVNTAAAEAALKRLTDRQRNISIGVSYRNGKPALP